MQAFLGLSKQNPTYTSWLFLSPPRDATKLSLFQVDWELPDPFPQAFVSNEGHGGPCCLILLPL